MKMRLLIYLFLLMIQEHKPFYIDFILVKPHSGYFMMGLFLSKVPLKTVHNVVWELSMVIKYFFGHGIRNL